MLFQVIIHNQQLLNQQIQIINLFYNYKYKKPKSDTYQLNNFNLDQVIKTNKDELLFLYERMQFMRRLEVTCDKLFKSQEIRGFCHLYDGQEAVLTGIEQVITFDDCLITSYRDHCHAYTRGDNAKQILCEMLGKANGSTKGIGGSMHLYRKKNNYYGGNGIVGAQTSVGAGIAFALQYLNKKNVCVSMYGDGAANQGQFFEAANMAALWKLPLIYICENNQYGMGTSVQRSTAQTNYYKRGETLPGLKIDGMNVFQVMSVMKFCKQYVLENGPIIIEADTYRYHGHSMSDPESYLGIGYRSREEINYAKQNRDPILQVKNMLLENKLIDEKILKNIDRKINDELDEAVEFARKDQQPNEQALQDNVYEKNTPFKINKVYQRGVELPDAITDKGKISF